MNINIIKLSNTATIPTKEQGSAGYDLYADIDTGEVIQGVLIRAGKTELIETNIIMEIPEGYFGAIYARSGLALNSGLRPANCVGIIDSSYRGSIKVAIRNDNNGIIWRDDKAVQSKIATKYILHGDRIAQIVIQPCEDVNFIETNELSQTKRGSGGFGSTGR